MELVIQICIAVIAVAFVVLMYFLIQAVKTLTGTLEETRKTIGQLRTEVTQISVDVKEAVHHTSAMTQDVRTKLKSLDSVFSSVNDIGHAVQAFTGAAKESAASISAKLRKTSKPAIQNVTVTPEPPPQTLSAIYDGIVSSIRIWRKLKKT